MLEAGIEVTMGEFAAHVGHGDEWRAIDRRMRSLAQRRAALDAEEGELILAAMRAEIHKHLGYGSFTEYLERACGYAPKTARDRIRVAEALEKLPATRAALAAGEVTYSTVRELSHVATPGTESEWLAAAEGRTTREVEQAVRGHARGDHPDDPTDPDLEPRKIMMELPPHVLALFLEARRHAEHTTGAPMTDADFMEIACRAILSSSTASETNQPPHAIALTVCTECNRGWQDAGGHSIEVPPSAIDRMHCDATNLGRVDGPTPARRTRSIPAATRRAVLARDHHRCAIPGCTSTLFVDVHHIHYRSHGGSNSLSNLLTLCTLHHSSIHDGRLLLSGPAASPTILHSDGRPYGTPPLDRLPPPPFDGPRGPDTPPPVPRGPLAAPDGPRGPQSRHDSPGHAPAPRHDR